MTQHPPGLARRALLAVALMIGFYLLAIAMAAGLLMLPFAEWETIHRVDIRLAIFGLLGAFAIFSAVVPRIDRFPDPGPRLNPNEHPRLFETVSEVAAAAQQAMPRDVFLVGDLNAWVAQRGGIMGFGSHRVMGLGLPLLTALSVAELRAVLAHEFGHFHGGDTALGPWVYKTRAAIERTVGNLSHRHSFLRVPFVWYGNTFLRITQKVSRHQELAADALAVQVAGAPALASGLRKIHASAPVFDLFVATELDPALDHGFQPPISGGFRHNLRVAGANGLLDGILAGALESGPADPYDSHPPLAERLAALPAGEEAVTEGAPALTLLENHDQLERALLAKALSPDKFARLRTIQWEELAAALWAPSWRSLVSGNSQRLAGLNPRSCTAFAGQLDRLAVHFRLAADPGVASGQHKAEAGFLVGAALTVLLLQHGWAAEALPGDDVILRKNSREYRPFAEVDRLFARADSADSWRGAWPEADLLDVDLGALASTLSTETS